MAHRTYQTREEAQEALKVKGKGYNFYKVKDGWRIRKRSKPKKRLKSKKIYR